MSGKTQIVLLPSGKRVPVPIKDDGSVDLGKLAMNMDAENMNKSHNDYEDHADVLFSAKNLTPRQAAVWMTRSDNVDIEGLDVKGRPLRNIGKRTGENAAVHKKVDVYGLPGQEETIRKTLDEAFSLEDRKKLVSKGRMEVEVRPMPMNTLGTHSGNNVSLRRLGGTNNAVLVHEGVHHLRQVDSSRKNPILRRFTQYDVKKGSATVRQNDAASVEESCTVAESVARQKGNDITGYYYKCQVLDKKTKRWRNPTPAEAEKMFLEDRKLFTNGTGKALNSAAAQKSVEKNWEKSNIARLKLGRRMAVNVMADSKPESGVKPLSKSPVKKPVAKTSVSIRTTGSKPKASASKRPRSSKR